MISLRALSYFCYDGRARERRRPSCHPTAILFDAHTQSNCSSKSFARWWKAYRAFHEGGHAVRARLAGGEHHRGRRQPRALLCCCDNWHTASVVILAQLNRATETTLLLSVNPLNAFHGSTVDEPVATRAVVLPAAVCHSKSVPGKRGSYLKGGSVAMGNNRGCS